jgi:hypothetical protein
MLTIEAPTSTPRFWPISSMSRVKRLDKIKKNTPMGASLMRNVMIYMIMLLARAYAITVLNKNGQTYLHHNLLDLPDCSQDRRVGAPNQTSDHDGRHQDGKKLIVG